MAAGATRLSSPFEFDQKALFSVLYDIVGVVGSSESRTKRIFCCSACALIVKPFRNVLRPGKPISVVFLYLPLQFA